MRLDKYDNSEFTWYKEYIIVTEITGHYSSNAVYKIEELL